LLVKAGIPRDPFHPSINITSYEENGPVEFKLSALGNGGHVVAIFSEFGTKFQGERKYLYLGDPLIFLKQNKSREVRKSVKNQLDPCSHFSKLTIAACDRHTDTDT